MRETVVASFYADRKHLHPESKTDYLACLKIVQRSVERAGMRHCLLTDYATEAAALDAGISDVMTFDLPEPLMQATTWAQAKWLETTESEGVDTVFIGADCIVVRDFRDDLPDCDFAVAYMLGHKRWRINNGFMYCPAHSRERMARHFRRVALDTGPEMFDDMLAHERGLGGLPQMPQDFGTCARAGMRVAFLPLPKWNRYMTAEKTNPNPFKGMQEANVLHFMGQWERGKPHFFEGARRLGLVYLIRIVAPHFVAGVIHHRGVIVMSAPILRYMIGWDGRRLADYCRAKGWKWERV